eukprot:363899-Chlamydomonas_euryale.AAC.7
MLLTTACFACRQSRVPDIGRLAAAAPIAPPRPSSCLMTHLLIHGADPDLQLRLIAVRIGLKPPKEAGPHCCSQVARRDKRAAPAWLPRTAALATPDGSQK